MNRYQRLQMIGSGGSGTVYRALDRLTGDVVALKSMESSRGFSGSSQSVISQKLAHEFNILAGLRHPNIINVLDYGFDVDGSPYFTMTLLPEPLTIVEAGQKADFKTDIRFLIEQPFVTGSPPEQADLDAKLAQPVDEGGFGAVKLPDIQFDNSLRLEIVVRQTLIGGQKRELRQILFFHECFGEIARVESKENERDPNFTDAALVRFISF